ncbi:MAG: hypothetical protein P8Y67_05945 [Alphaproteobacteria bacterium]
MIPTLTNKQRNQYSKPTSNIKKLARWVLLSGTVAGVGIAVLSAAGALITEGTAATIKDRHISVKLNGDILPVCKLLDVNGLENQALAFHMSPDDITKPGASEFKFIVDCNIPFEYRLEAQYGALAHQDGKSASGKLTAEIPYHVAVHIPTSGAPIDDQCWGKDLQTGKTRCQFSNSGNAIALKRTGKLTLAWMPKGTLLAGQYSEKLTIKVNSRP